MAKKYTIATLPGDGIGPEVVREAKKILSALANKNKTYSFDFVEALVGASAIDECGEPYPDVTHETCLSSDAVLFGAIGDPKYDNDPQAKVRPEQGLLKMRKMLGLFANIRPVQSFSALEESSPLKNEIIKGVDFVVYRELTSGIYFGEPRGRSEDGKKAYDTCLYTEEEITRLVEMGFKQAQVRNKKLTLVDKANVLATSRLWRETTQKISKKYADVSVEYMFVDNAAMQLILNPSQFDVIVTENMFGDIITDEASVITGSLGLLPSASVGEHVALYEPIHGSYPQAANKNIANPLGAILSAAMMLEYSLNQKDDAEIIKKAVESSLSKNIVTIDLSKENAKNDIRSWRLHYRLHTKILIRVTP